MRIRLTSIVIVAALALASATSAQQTEKRIALVIGNAAYQAEPLPTAANDAGLIAQTLQAAGFDVVGARDLDQDTLRRTFRDFLDKATASGPDTVAFVFLGGYGVQLEGENYFVPVDAKIARDTDVPVEALRISDYARPLAALKLKAGILVLDAARPHPFAKSGQPLASGLSLVEPDKGMLVAFNAAPGTVAPQEKGPYGAYAQALAEMMRTGGLPLGEVFDRVRLRVNEMTKGGEVPWNASKVEAPLVFFERAADAPPPAVSNDQVSSIRSKPIRDLDARDAYIAALERDTLQGYLDFLAAYPDDQMAKRVRAIVAARREAITWRRTRSVDTPQAYWSYLRRYPRGPHVADARRRLAQLAAEFEPPPSFAVITYDVPPPPEEEVVYFRRPVLFFDDPDYGFVPPPPPPIFFLPPPPPDFVVLEPPPPAFGLFILPIPRFVPVPTYYRRPVYVAPPPPNVIYNNIHNTVVINATTNMVTITQPSGQTQTVTPAQALQPVAARQPAPGASTVPSRTPAVSPGVAAAVGAGIGAAAGAALLAPSLPPSVAQKAIKIQQQPPTTPGAQPIPPAQQQGQPRQPSQLAQPPRPGQPLVPGQTPAPGKALPGQRGQPLPPVPGAVPTTRQPGQPPRTGQPPVPGQTPPPGKTLPEQRGQPLPSVPGAVPATRQPGQPPRTGQPHVPGLTPPSSKLPAPNAAPATPRPGQPSTRPAQPETRRKGQPSTPPAGARPRTPVTAAPPSPAVKRPVTPPPVVKRPATPPPAVKRPPTPPPVVTRTAPPPPAVKRPATPPPAVRRTAPPPAAAKPPACASGLRLVNGKCVK